MKAWALVVFPLLLLLLASGCGPAEGRAEWPEVEEEAVQQAEERMAEHPVVEDASARVIERRIQLEIKVPTNTSQAEAKEGLKEFARLMGEMQPEMDPPGTDYLGELWDYHYLEAVAICPDETTLVAGFRCLHDEHPQINFNGDY